MPRLRRARLSDNAGVTYVDPSTGQHYPLTEARWCADNGHYLNLAPAPGLGRADIDASRHSVWRYAKALRVDSAHAVSLGEGGTPLVAGEWKGASVLYKLEFMMPTGSFKDRGMTVMVSYLKSRGLDRVLEDSSGNAGASLAAYAAAAGMGCRILVPETASYPKIAQIAAGGADVVTIKGSRQDVAEAALRQSAEIFYASHNWQPFFVEGIKTLAYELWEQLGFAAPDSIVVPLGYGSNVLGADVGFAELLRRGEIGRRPRIFGVQQPAAPCWPLPSRRAPSASCRRRSPRRWRRGSRPPSPRASPRCCAPSEKPADRSSPSRRPRSWRPCAILPAGACTWSQPPPSPRRA